ncbi:hypothetical protein [Sphingomonas sp.]|uniref:hypothetical protein n=1 Tax=Sphingomonas sp. TaxID=28214 RepID=UPI00185AB76A|nr:hypothetical protein [Sphingomonas sp.]MBA4763060.1 hypothetical protein [Sphingomonas sp.]
MVLFALITPVALSFVGAWVLARYRISAIAIALLVAVAAVAATFGLLRLRYSLFEIGPFMLLPQAASFLFAIATSFGVVRHTRRRQP